VSLWGYFLIKKNFGIVATHLFEDSWNNLLRLIKGRFMVSVEHMITKIDNYNYDCLYVKTEVGQENE